MTQSPSSSSSETLCLISSAQGIIPMSCLLSSSSTSSSNASIIAENTNISSSNSNSQHNTTSPSTSISSASSILSNVYSTYNASSPDLQYMQFSNASSTNYTSNLRKSSSSSHQDFQEIWFNKFNSTLPKRDGVYVINTTEKFNQLLNFYYQTKSRFNQNYSNQLFPYLHDLSTRGHEDNFTESYNHMKDILHIIDSMHLNNLMFIKSDDEEIDSITPDLINSVKLDQILDRHYNEWEKLSVYPHQYDEHDMKMNCRNFGRQLKLMAPLSHFVVYNYTNSDNANVLSMLRKVVNPEKYIYSVELDKDWWSTIEPNYFDNDTDEDPVYNNSFLSKFYPSEEEFTSQGEHFVSRYHRYEQNVIWRMSGNRRTWLFDNKICVGNILDYNELVKALDNEFKLIIYCDDDIQSCNFPPIETLQWIYHDYSQGGANSYCLKIPQLGGNKDIDLVGVLNVLKLIVKLSKVNKVFIGSHDGFTSSTIWLVLLTQLLNRLTIEESILYLAKQEIKLFFFDNDYSLLQDLEIFVDYLNKHLLLEFPTIILPSTLDLNSIDRFYFMNPIVKPQPYDWFADCQGQLNLPSKVYPHLYLGSLLHSSSNTILETFGISNIISIDELPSWWNQMFSKYIQFDYEQRLAVPVVLKPIYKYDNIKIYEVNFEQLHHFIPYKVQATLPSSLNSLIYIHNFKDDGKDSILPMLLDAPPFIHDKILLGQSPKKSTLIHCKVGVSRSATLVIASIMKHFRIGLVQAYFMLRIIRFNIIIQPNLKLFYELFLYEEYLGLPDQLQDGKKVVKKWNWEFIADEIHRLNQIYTSSSSS